MPHPTFAAFALPLAILAGVAATPAMAQDGKFFPIPGREEAKFLPVAAGGTFRPVDRGNGGFAVDRQRDSGRAAAHGTTPPPLVIRTARAAQAQTALYAAPPADQEALQRVALVTPPRPARVMPPAGTSRVWPVDHDVASRVSSGYGWRQHPVTGERSFHSGVDIAARSGTAVLATAAGVIHGVGEHPRLGRYVMITYRDGSVGTYGHLQRIDARTGRTVAAGEQIGTVGSTGRATGPHLDYSLRVDGRTVDPLPLLRQPAIVVSR